MRMVNFTTASNVGRSKSKENRVDNIPELLMKINMCGGFWLSTTKIGMTKWNESGDGVKIENTNWGFWCKPATKA